MLIIHLSFEMFYFDQCARVQTEAANQEEQCFLLVFVRFKPLSQMLSVPEMVWNASCMGSCVNGSRDRHTGKSVPISRLLREHAGNNIAGKST